MNLIKINCDVAWNKHTCKAGLGVVACNHHGFFICGLAKPDTTGGSVLIVECESILEGLLLARDFQFG